MKQSKNLDEMVELFEERGLPVLDAEKLKNFLYDCNYYRLSGYFRAFQRDPKHGDNRFILGTTLDDFLIPYLMDEQLRSRILEGTAILERTVGARFSYLLAQAGEAYTYLDESSYSEYRSERDKRAALEHFPSHGSPRSQLFRELYKWLSSSKEVCIRHYRKVKEPVPVWAAVEALPFGPVSKMLSLHRNTKVLRDLYESLGFQGREWKDCAPTAIQAMCYLRNMCAHHSRLWKKEIVSATPMPRGAAEQFHDIDYEDKSVMKSLIVLCFLVNNINGNDSYSSMLFDFIRQDAAYYEGIIAPVHWD